ncbi:MULTISPECIES: Lrp/AsnC family transcriptional regulator [Streptomyces]|uniref:Lrp/AsnC family transcriptional regulator n=1 Tax=Streptomyces TaxID=1883 RepID=UPI001966B37B|nr:MULTISPECIES: Lrp/AsnC family transcriptional regulator [Streptomyces]QRX93306.1 Lrp/AsnC family transcriptional regulator [Streptomyces noursei]UJB43020.1 Lrp/AsnC family transcriptional regulator [Streptomyces sp. A1-5]
MKTDGTAGRPAPFDELDRRLIHALQTDGRAPFSRIGAVLGVSDQTVARRYTRHRGSGAFRVLGLAEPRALGEVEWLVRVQCAPDAALPVAEALARRPDTSWVSLMSGGTEIAAVCRSASSEHSDALLLQKLPRTPSVVGVAAHCLLHEFYGGPQSMISKSGALTAEEAARLSPPPPRRRAEPVVLSDADRRLFEALGRDGRAPLDELAAVTGWSPTTVRRRLAALRADGVLYYDVDYDLRLFGYGVMVALWLSVEPAELAATGEALATHPEVAFAGATTGPNNLFASVLCRDTSALYTYLTTRVAALPGVRTMESSPRIRHLKGPGPYLAFSPAAPRSRR